MSEIAVIIQPLAICAFEAISALICFALLFFMIKPYVVTHEARYIGLPFGFGFLGFSYLLSAIASIHPSFLVNNYVFDNDWEWIQLITRSFAFAFLAFNYFFSRKHTEKNRLIWDITLGLLSVSFMIALLVIFILPIYEFGSYQIVNISSHVLNIVCITYICIHCLREHVQSAKSSTLLVPFGYTLLGISQYSRLIFVIEGGAFELWGSLVLRLLGLFVFIFIAYQTFIHSQEKGSIK